MTATIELEFAPTSFNICSYFCDVVSLGGLISPFSFQVEDKLGEKIRDRAITIITNMDIGHLNFNKAFIIFPPISKFEQYFLGKYFVYHFH